jgi:polyhydroxybutyrate depolymerase
MLKKLGIASALVITILLAMYGYFVHSYSKVSPPESGTIKHQSLNIDGLQRSFQYYLPEAHTPSALLVFALHGSMGSSNDMRWQTGFGFEHIAATDKNLIVVYPNGFERHWNDCRATASYSANTQNIDDIAFFKEMITYFTEIHGINPDAVFATGVSNGGHMSYKLAMEMPEQITAIAPIVANIPVTENLDCTPKQQPMSVTIFNGMQDPVNPFEGGKVVLFGNDSRGTVMSSSESINYWLNLVSDKPDTHTVKDTASKSKIEEWQAGNYRFELYHLNETGHVIASNKVRFGRLAGPNASGIEVVDEIWQFFKQVSSNPTSQQNSL